MQLELPLNIELPPENSWGRIEYRVASIKDSFDRVRKRLMAQNNELRAKNEELERRLSIIEKYICQME